MTIHANRVKISALNLSLVVVFFCSPANAEAANRYVRQGAAGSGSGSDWTNAYAALPATLTRGDTYYIADGSYSSYSFNDAPSGTTVITIKKATTADHGTAVGWSSAYGDGVATFAGIDFTTRYWVFDGQVGGGPSSWKTGFGFKITRSSSSPVILIAGGGNITLRHLETQGAGNNGSAGGVGNDSLQVTNGSGPITLSYAYLEGAGRCHVYHGGGSTNTVTIEYTYTGQFESTSGEHSEWAVLRSSALFVVRWSVITHEEGTGGIIAGDNGQTTAEIYGNVFYDSGAFGSWGSGNNGLIAAFSLNSAAVNWKVYNNTFIDLPSDLSAFGISGQNPSGNQARNNYFYLTTNHSVGSGWSQSFEHFQNSGNATGTNGTTGSGDPFVNYAGYNFALKVGTAAGQVLSSPYNVDMFGNIRGADGTWDRGAIEFTGATAKPPAAPSNLRITALD